MSTFAYVGTPAKVEPFVATAESDNAPPRVLLELTWPAVTSATVERLDPDNRWRPVRGAEPAQVAGVWVGYDYEAPLGALVRYRARAGTVGTLSTAEVIVDAAVPWLVHPGVPSYSRAVRLKSWSAQEQVARSASFSVIGSPYPVIVSQPRLAPAWTVVVRTSGAAERRALQTLLDDGSPLLLNIPVGLGWDEETCWVSVGTISRVRLGGYATDGELNHTLPLQEVTRPAGGVRAQWTWAGLAAERLTWDDVEQGYYSWADLVAQRPQAATGTWDWTQLKAEHETWAELLAIYSTWRDVTAHRPA